jgi:hypothetical protein
MSDYTLLVPLVAICIILSSMYKNIGMKRQERTHCDIDKYINENGIIKNRNAPIMWIYMTSDIYANDWDEFGSIVNDKNVQPYISLCIKSIIAKCQDDFNIVLVNDSSLPKIIPDWETDMNKIPDPLKGKVRDIATTKILYLYGGLFVPPSLLCMKSLIEPYNNAIINHNILVGELSNKNIMSHYMDFSPSFSLIGCEKENQTMLHLKNSLDDLSSDYTSESLFNEKIQKLMINIFKSNNISVLDAERIGLKDSEGYMVTVDRLLGTNYIPFDRSIYGVYIPMNDISTKKMYRWFSKISVDDIILSKTIIGELVRYNI